jgi:hypothetical protein
MALVDVAPFVEDGDAQTWFLAQFQRGEDSGRSRADDDDVVLT